MESSAPSLGSALVSLRASWHPRCRPLARPEHENRPGPPQFRKRGRTRQAPGGFRSALVKPGKTSQLQLSARWAGTGISAFGRYDARWRVRALPVLGGAIRRLSVKRSAGPARSKAPAHVRPSCFSARERLQPVRDQCCGRPGMHVLRYVWHRFAHHPSRPARSALGLWRCALRHVSCTRHVSLCMRARHLQGQRFVEYSPDGLPIRSRITYSPCIVCSSCRSYRNNDRLLAQRKD